MQSFKTFWRPVFEDLCFYVSFLSTSVNVALMVQPESFKVLMDSGTTKDYSDGERKLNNNTKP